MPIDLTIARNAQLLPIESSWDPDKVILYHLGIGAGLGKGKATDPQELAYTYEKGLKVLPSFAVVPVLGIVADLNAIDGIDVDHTKVLHGEHELDVHRPLPVAGNVRSTVRVAGIHDKGSGAVIILEATSSDAHGPLFTNRFSAFVRGEGGFGGEQQDARQPPRPPEREPDAVIEMPTTEHQALLYRLSGDKNPMHADPDHSARGGFDRPILHGLCTYGAVCKAVIDELLSGDVTRVARYSVRFAGVVFPGETIVTELWHDSGRIVLRAATAERGEPVLSNAAIKLR